MKIVFFLENSFFLSTDFSDRDQSQIFPACDVTRRWVELDFFLLQGRTIIAHYNPIHSKYYS